MQWEQTRSQKRYLFAALRAVDEGDVVEEHILVLHAPVLALAAGASGRLEVEGALARPLEAKGHVVVVEGVAGHGLLDLGELLARVAQRVAPDRRVVEEVLHRDLGAREGCGARLDRAHQFALRVARLDATNAC